MLVAFSRNCNLKLGFKVNSQCLKQLLFIWAYNEISRMQARYCVISFQNVLIWHWRRGMNDRERKIKSSWWLQHLNSAGASPELSLCLPPAKSLCALILLLPSWPGSGCQYLDRRPQSNTYLLKKVLIMILYLASALLKCSQRSAGWLSALDCRQGEKVRAQPLLTGIVGCYLSSEGF